MVERRFCTPEVRSSILLGSTDTKISPTSVVGIFVSAGHVQKANCLAFGRIEYGVEILLRAKRGRIVTDSPSVSLYKSGTRVHLNYMKTNTTLYKISSLVLLALVISTGTLSYTKAEGNQITVCVKNDGLMYVIGGEFKRSECKENDSLLSWNVKGIQGPKGEKGDVGPMGPQGEKGDSLTLPTELKPTVSNLTICKQRSGNGVAFRWSLTNSYGIIPKKLSADQNISTGISWGEVTIHSVLSPDYPTYTYKANGTHHTLSFSSADNIGNGSPLEFTGVVYWNGFSIPVLYSGTWSENLPQCLNDGFSEGF